MIHVLIYTRCNVTDIIQILEIIGLSLSLYNEN